MSHWVHSHSHPGASGKNFLSPVAPWTNMPWMPNRKMREQEMIILAMRAQMIA